MGISASVKAPATLRICSRMQLAPIRRRGGWSTSATLCGPLREQDDRAANDRIDHCGNWNWNIWLTLSCRTGQVDMHIGPGGGEIAAPASSCGRASRDARLRLGGPLGEPRRAQLDPVRGPVDTHTVGPRDRDGFGMMVPRFCGHGLGHL